MDRYTQDTLTDRCRSIHLANERFHENIRLKLVIKHPSVGERVGTGRRHREKVHFANLIASIHSLNKEIVTLLYQRQRYNKHLHQRQGNVKKYHVVKKPMETYKKRAKQNLLNMILVFCGCLIFSSSTEGSTIQTDLMIQIVNKGEISFSLKMSQK